MKWSITCRQMRAYYCLVRADLIGIELCGFLLTYSHVFDAIIPHVLKLNTYRILLT